MEVRELLHHEREHLGRTYYINNLKSWQQKTHGGGARIVDVNKSTRSTMQLLSNTLFKHDK